MNQGQHLGLDVNLRKSKVWLTGKKTGEEVVWSECWNPECSLDCDRFMMFIGHPGGGPW